MLAYIENNDNNSFMEWLNYHHLYYFWTVAKLGSVTKATQKLKLAQPTISGQIGQLEDALGVKLFQKKGRGLMMTEMGQMVFRYAEEIFTTGEDLMYALKNPHWNRPSKVMVGVQMVIPKLLAYEFLKTLFEGEFQVVPVCLEDNLEQLLSKLALRELDIVFSDRPVTVEYNIKAFSHLLGTSSISFCATKSILKGLDGTFPTCLHDAAMILPSEGNVLHAALLQWFERMDIHPQIRAEVQDTALMKVLGQRGHGVFPIPTIISEHVCKKYSVEVIGETSDVQESFYAITIERKISHPSLKAITDKAKGELFSS